MGWGCNTALRNSFLSDCIVQKEPTKQYAVVTDMCGKARHHACGKSPRSAKIVAKGLCTNLWKRATHLVVMMFDDAQKIHPIRNVLHQRRYKPLTAAQQQTAEAKGKIIVHGQAYDPDLVPYTSKEIEKMTIDSNINWRRLWPAMRGKAKAFDLIREACVHWHQQNCAPTRQLVVWDKNGVLTYPYHNEEAAEIGRMLCNNTGGEADTKAAEAVKSILRGNLSKTCIIDTIDTDMILQMTASVEMISTLPPVFLRLMNETIDIRQLISKFGNDDSSMRLSAAFWMIALGCDYCQSLTRFGWLSTEILETSSPKYKPVIEVSEDGKTATYKGSVFLEISRGIKRRNVKNKTWEELEAEIHNILFCVSYFSGADKNRPEYAGPDVTSSLLFARQGSFTATSYETLCSKDCYDQEIKITF